MSSTAILLGGISLALAFYLAMLPILTNRQAAEAAQQQVATEKLTVQQLRNRYWRLLNSIRDLDFDYDTGKVSDDVYIEQRKMLLGRSVSVLMQLDQAEATLARIDDEIEAEIAAFRNRKVA